MPSDPLLPEANEVRLRLYGQGLGDCFLLAFPRREEGARPCYLVIDCGVAMSTPDRVPRTKEIVKNLKAATGGRIDVLVVTHQHFDHVSSFQDARPEWQEIQVDALYLPWTEAADPKGEHKSAPAFRKALDEAARAALAKAVQAGALEDQPGFRAQADFLGVSLGAAGDAPAGMDGAMEFARSLCPAGKVRYFEPGDVFALPGTESHGYVLGPPLPDKTDAKGRKYIELLVDGAEGVMYSYADLGMKVDEGLPGGDRSFAMSDDRAMPALASAVLAAGALDRTEDDGFSPFAPEVRLDWDGAMASSYFRNRYGEGERGENGAWRRIDGDWLAGSSALALRAGDYTNNLSFVLAFDVPGSDKMLLFPGDAQVGNWLSWHKIEGWSYRDPSAPARPPSATEDQTLMENLLSRVAFYKVGHHGSHNATIKAQGLEKMTRPDLSAFVPVSVPVAQDLMGYCPMPFYPVLQALVRKTAGRVFLPNGEAVGAQPSMATSETLRGKANVALAAETLPEKRRNGVLLEGPVPLYLEVTVGA
jgi:hypothetical protein